MIASKLRCVRDSCSKKCSAIVFEIQSTVSHDRICALKLEIDILEKRLTAANKDMENLFNEELDAKTDDDEMILEQIDKHCAESEILNDQLAEISCMLQSKLQLWASQESVVAHNNSNFHDSHIRLPKLNLPTFSGNVLEWHEFFESFVAAVHKSDISDIEKFTYLRSQLKGDALNSISGISLTGANYAVALGLLKERFGDESMCIRAHIRQLLNIDPLLVLDVKPLRMFLDKLHVHIRCLRTLGVAEDCYGIFLSEIVLSRIPKLVKIDFSKLESTKQTLSGLMDLLERQLKCQELLASTDTSSSAPSVSSSSQKPPASKMFHKPASFSLVSSYEDTKCLFCKVSGHKSSFCSKFKSCSPDERLTMVKDHRACFNCLGSHSARFCTSKFRCSVCSRMHHSLLHSSFNKPEGQSSTDTKCGAVSSSRATSVSPVVNLEFSLDCGSSSKLGALLDTGSHLSFLKRSALHLLEYRLVGQRQMNIQGFANVETEGLFDIVECVVLAEDKSRISLQFFVVDQLCGNYIKRLSKGYNGTFVLSSEEIHLIVGNDNYFKIVTGSHEFVDDELVAINTIGGWTYHGSFVNTPRPACFVAQEHAIEEPIDLKKFWELEYLGISDLEHYDSESTVVSDFERDIVMENGRYFVRLPWNGNLFCVDECFRRMTKSSKAGLLLVLSRL
jgi:hypothetical protein